MPPWQALCPLGHLLTLINYFCVKPASCAQESSDGSKEDYVHRQPKLDQENMLVIPGVCSQGEKHILSQQCKAWV